MCFLSKDVDPFRFHMWSSEFAQKLMVRTGMFHEMVGFNSQECRI